MVTSLNCVEMVPTFVLTSVKEDYNMLKYYYPLRLYLPDSMNQLKEVKKQRNVLELPMSDQPRDVEKTPPEVDNGSDKSMHPCSVNNGNCEHKCSAYRGKAKCVCRPGYTLRRDRRTCKGASERMTP